MTIQEIERMGFKYTKWATDVMGVKHRICLSPLDGSGGVNYFDSLSEVRKFLDDVKLKRAMEEGDEEYLRRRRKIEQWRAGVPLIDLID